MRHVWLHGLLLVVAVVASGAEQAPGKGAVASAHPLATQAGEEILSQGGNAFDAAVAVSAALMVVEPSGSGFLGGGMYLLHRAKDGRNVVIDAREVAPLKATRDMFLDAAGNPVRGASTNTALAAGIPGEPAGLALMQSRYGRLKLSQTLQPAIRLARDGFEMYPRLNAGIAFKRNQIIKSAEGAAVWFRDGAGIARGRARAAAAAGAHAGNHREGRLRRRVHRQPRASSWSPPCRRWAASGRSRISRPTRPSSANRWWVISGEPRSSALRPRLPAAWR